MLNSSWSWVCAKDGLLNRHLTQFDPRSPLNLNLLYQYMINMEYHHGDADELRIKFQMEISLLLYRMFTKCITDVMETVIIS